MVTTLEVYRSRLRGIESQPVPNRRVISPKVQTETECEAHASAQARMMARQAFAGVFQLAGKFDALIDRYLSEYSRPHRDSATADAEHFLYWLTRNEDSPAGRDGSTLSGPFERAADFAALRQRIAQRRFERLSESTTPWAPKSQRDWKQTISLNPLRMWATCETRLRLEEECIVPARVLFYLACGEVRSVVMDADMEWLIRQLEQGPVTVRMLLQGQCPESQSETLSHLQDLQDAQLVVIH